MTGDQGVKVTVYIRVHSWSLQECCNLILSRAVLYCKQSCSCTIAGVAIALRLSWRQIHRQPVLGHCFHINSVRKLAWVWNNSRHIRVYWWSTNIWQSQCFSGYLPSHPHVCSINSTLSVKQILGRSAVTPLHVVNVSLQFACTHNVYQSVRP